MATLIAASAADGTRLAVSPLQGNLPFGAIVSDLTLADLDDPRVVVDLNALWLDAGVIVFRGESTPEMHVALSQCFGPLERHSYKEAWAEGHPELVKIKYYPEDGTVYEIDGERRGGWLPWHSDLIYTDTINHGGMLRPVQLPSRLGQTGFIDQIDAYDRLPDGMKQRIEGLHVVYEMDLNMANHKFGKPGSIRFVRGARSFMAIMRREFEYPRVIHPLVFEQPGTGRKVLNLSPAFAVGIYEMGGPDGEELLRELTAHCIDGPGSYFHDWREGDMVLWDNWRVMHSAIGVPADETRVMHRTTIAGDYALGRRLDGGVGLPRIDV